MKCWIVCYLFVLSYIQYISNLNSKNIYLSNSKISVKNKEFLKNDKNIFKEIKNLIKDELTIEVNLYFFIKKERRSRN